MRICVNGEEIETSQRTTVAELVAEKGLNPDVIVVEHNLTVLPSEKWQEAALADGDRLEIVTFMGGG